MRFGPNDTGTECRDPSHSAPYTRRYTLAIAEDPQGECNQAPARK